MILMEPEYKDALFSEAKKRNIFMFHNLQKNVKYKMHT